MLTEQLSEIIFAYNSAKHASTGFSPAMLNLGQEPAMLHSLRRQVDDETQKQLEREALEEWKRRMERLSLLRKDASANMARAQENYARHYNNHRRDVSYAVEDQVWRDNHVLSSGAQGFTAKLASRYLGPFTVTKVLGTNTYKLTDAVGVAEGPVHVRQLKPYITSDESADEEEDADDDALIGEPQPPRETANQATSDPPSASESVGSEGSSEPAEPRRRGPGQPRTRPAASEPATAVDAPPPLDASSQVGPLVKRSPGWLRASAKAVKRGREKPRRQAK